MGAVVRSIKDALGADGAAPIMAERARVSFNGTGTVAIRAAKNVLGVTDLGVGFYRVNFEVHMPDDEYVAPLASGGSGSIAVAYLRGATPKNVAYVDVGIGVPGVGSSDSEFVEVVVSR